MAGKLLLALIADIIWRLPIANIPWPGPIDGILRRVPMDDIVGVVLRSLREVLRSMENDHEVPREGGIIRRINTLKRVVFAANFRQSYVAQAYQGHGKKIRNEHHRLMAGFLREIIEGDYRYREALYDPRLRWEGEGNRRIRRRNKQRRRRAQHRWIKAKGHLESCIRKLIREAMLYHLICEIEKEQGRSFEFSVVSTEIDVGVIEVMVTLFPHFLFMVTSCIDLVGKFQHYDVLPEIQDGDSPWKYRGGRFTTMSEASGSSYNSNYRGHVCDMDQCVLQTSLQLHNFGRRFYGCRHWKPGSDEHCKSFKWLDGIPCRRGAEIAPIVIAKFSRLEAEAAMAKNNEMEARAMIADLLHRERVAKRSAEKARVSLRMANARARKYQIALLMSWLAVVVFFIISLGNREVGLRQMCLP